MTTHEFKHEIQKGVFKQEAEIVKETPAILNISSTILARNWIAAEAHLNIQIQKFREESRL